ncbi:MAG TPA: peptidoglycan-binding domain-containing protein [Chthoniobacterales bacterium]
MKIAVLLLSVCGSLGFGVASAQDLEELWFRSSDVLAQRDEYGLLHQSTFVHRPDVEPRYYWRPLYYLEGANDLARMPAYVGTLQVTLARLGYYRGPIDGVFSEDVSTALAHLQKNYSMRVTGTITVPVRRALHLP